MMKGVAFAVASGICYGLYTAFLTLGETQGVWGAWFAGEAWNGNAPLSAFAITFTLAALAAGLNDLFSGLWSLVMCAKNGQLGRAPLRLSALQAHHDLHGRGLRRLQD